MITESTVTTRQPTVSVTYRWVPVPGSTATELRMFQGNFDLRLAWVQRTTKMVRAYVYYTGESENQNETRSRTELTSVSLENVADRLAVMLLADGIVMPALTDDCFAPVRETTRQ